MKIRSGIDTVHIPRIEKICDSHQAFLTKCFTPDEIGYAKSHTSKKRVNEIFAGRFAAKEAVAKALGTGIMAEGIELTDIEVLPDAKGTPQLNLYGEALKKAQELCMTSSSVSITHEKDFATAVCVLLCDEEV